MTGHPTVVPHHRLPGKTKPYLKRKPRRRVPGLLAYLAQRLRDVADELDAMEELPGRK